MRVLWWLVGVMALVVGVSGCGSSERSVAAYCSTFYGDGGQMHARWQRQAASGDLSQALAMTFTAPGELASFFGRLDKVAPDEVEPDVRTLHDNMQELADGLGSTAGDPVQGLFKSFALSVGSKAAENHVNAYTLAHCGRPPN